MKNIRKMQRGFSLVSAIFLLVVIAALGTFAITLSTTQQQSVALDVMGARAYQAARAGVDWGAYQIIQSAVAGGSFAADCQTGATSRVVAPLPDTLAGFRVNVECGGDSPATVAAASAVESPDHPPGSELRVYTLTSTATQGTLAATDYVERQMTVIIAQ